MLHPCRICGNPAKPYLGAFVPVADDGLCGSEDGVYEDEDGAIFLRHEGRTIAVTINPAPPEKAGEAWWLCDKHATSAGFGQVVDMMIKGG